MLMFKENQKHKIKITRLDKSKNHEFNMSSVE